MIQVSIPSANLRRMSGIGKESKKPYDLAFQDGYFHTFDKDGVKAPFPQKVEIMLPKDKDGASLFFQPGEYQLAPHAVYVDRNGKLAVDPSALTLVKLAAPARPTQA
jgi:hypothetical protein